MPFTRTLTASFLLILLILAAIGGGDHPWLTPEALWIAVLLAFLLWLLSYIQDFFLDVVVILFSAFFLQRVIVIYIWPDQLDYQTTLNIPRGTVTLALVFSTLCAGATCAGYWLVKLPRQGRSRLIQMTASERVRVLDRGIPFDLLFRLYGILAIPLFCVEIVLLFGLGIGIGGYVFNPVYAPLYRISFLARSLGIVAFLPLLVQGTSWCARGLAFVLVAILLVLGVASTSKGALLALLIGLLVCMHFAGRKIPNRYFWYLVGLLLFVVVFYIPIVMALRGTLLEGKTWGEALANVKELDFRAYGEVVSGFSTRLGGLDWLVGFMTVGRDTFPGYVGLRGDVVLAFPRPIRTLLNNYVPGEIIPQEGLVGNSYLIPFYLRGLPLPVEGAIRAHGENFGLLGTAYVYFGWVGGIAFVFVWAAISTWVLSSTVGRIYKILYLYMFVIDIFAGGGFSTPIARFYEALISLVISYLLYRWFYELGPFCVGKRPRMPEASRPIGGRAVNGDLEASTKA